MICIGRLTDAVRPLPKRWQDDKGIEMNKIQDYANVFDGIKPGPDRSPGVIWWISSAR